MRTTLLYAVLALSATTFVASLPLEPGNIEARVAALDVINEDALALEARGKDNDGKKPAPNLNKPLPPTPGHSPNPSIASNKATDGGSGSDSHRASDGSSLTTESSKSGTDSQGVVHVKGGEDAKNANNGKGNTRLDKAKQKVFGGQSGNGGGA
jgi:hypothetical protein